MKKKYKILTALVAVALCASLTAAGVLMLYSAETESALNVVTIGKGIPGKGDAFAVELQEKGGVIKEDNTHASDYTGTYKTLGKDSFTGIDYDVVVPNQRIDKMPRVRRTDADGAAGYLRVKAEWLLGNELVTATTGDDSLAIIKDLYGTVTSDATAATGIYGLGSNWVYSANSDGVGGYFYYVADRTAAPPNLLPLEAPTGTATETITLTDIFKGIQIKDYADTDLGAFEALSEEKLTLKLTAELIQVDWNTAYNEGDPLYYAFAGYFGTPQLVSSDVSPEPPTETEPTEGE